MAQRTKKKKKPFVSVIVCNDTRSKYFQHVCAFGLSSTTAQNIRTLRCKECANIKLDGEFGTAERESRREMKKNV